MQISFFCILRGIMCFGCSTHLDNIAISPHLHRYPWYNARQQLYPQDWTIWSLITVQWMNRWTGRYMVPDHSSDSAAHASYPSASKDIYLVINHWRSHQQFDVFSNCTCTCCVCWWSLSELRREDDQISVPGSLKSVTTTYGQVQEVLVVDLASPLLGLRLGRLDQRREYFLYLCM